jgi:hypothetical protein
MYGYPTMGYHTNVIHSKVVDRFDHNDPVLYNYMYLGASL